VSLPGAPHRADHRQVGLARNVQFLLSFVEGTIEAEVIFSDLPDLSPLRRYPGTSGAEPRALAGGKEIR